MNFPAYWLQEDKQDEENQLVQEETDEYAENWHRSDEEGWFYPDKDDGELCEDDMPDEDEN